MVALLELMAATAARHDDGHLDGFGEPGAAHRRQVIGKHGVLQQPVAVCQPLPVRCQRVKFGASTRTRWTIRVGEDLQTPVSQDVQPFIDAAARASYRLLPESLLQSIDGLGARAYGNYHTIEQASCIPEIRVKCCFGSHREHDSGIQYSLSYRRLSTRRYLLPDGG